MTKKAPVKIPTVRHATQYVGKTVCRVEVVDSCGDASMSLAEVSDLARRAGFKPADARLEIAHEQGRAYVSDVGDGESAYADVDSCEWRAELVFDMAKCAFCQKSLQLKEAKLKKRNADRRAARQRRAAA